MYGKTTINTFRSGPEIYFVFSAYQSFQKWQLLVIICSRLAQILCWSGQDATCLRAVSDRLATSMDPRLNLYHLQTPFLEKKRERERREKPQVEKEKQENYLHECYHNKFNVLSKWWELFYGELFLQKCFLSFSILVLTLHLLSKFL